MNVISLRRIERESLVRTHSVGGLGGPIAPGVTIGGMSADAFTAVAAGLGFAGLLMLKASVGIALVGGVGLYAGVGYLLNKQFGKVAA